MEHQRLYRLNPCRYLQHDGTGPLPAEVSAYARRHRGELPAYIPLPAGPTVFRVDGLSVAWDGSGPLPSAVTEYVGENGILPLSKSAEAELAR